MKQTENQRPVSPFRQRGDDPEKIFPPVPLDKVTDFPAFLGGVDELRAPHLHEGVMNGSLGIPAGPRHFGGIGLLVGKQIGRKIRAGIDPEKSPQFKEQIGRMIRRERLSAISQLDFIS